MNFTVVSADFTSAVFGNVMIDRLNVKLSQSNFLAMW